MVEIEKVRSINYSGVFMSCFAEHDTKSVEAIPNHSINYVCTGEQIIESGNDRIVVEAGEAVFVRRNHRTKIYKHGKDGETYKGISLILDRNVLRNFYKTMDKGNIPKDVQISDDNVMKIGRRADTRSLFESLTPYFDDNLKPTEAVAHLKSLEGIYALLNTSDIFYQVLFDFADPWKIDLLEFLEDNYMDDLTMEDIARYTGRSLATFKRDFKKISNLSPQKWLIKRRLEAAFLLLQARGKKVQEVYLEVGFKNPSHFSKAFKALYGFAPTEIKRDEV
ncbi:helix-turn-helix domain-containing protein [Chryseobacterium indologenes]|uniref:helix-turn-helix domain-containing protein n=1 Tax=Chryseobacterium indologenes TaxID=253 RepID=UPI00110963CC|nr:helix-turn-helix domain-containing protein [Chryseobacterium indologenes]